jgi:hypothetical protein
VLAGLLGVVGEVAGEEDEVRLARQAVDGGHRLLERPIAVWTVETDVGVTELREGERGRSLARLRSEPARQLRRLCRAAQARPYGIQSAHSHRSAGDLQESPSVRSFFIGPPRWPPRSGDLDVQTGETGVYSRRLSSL